MLAEGSQLPSAMVDLIISTSVQDTSLDEGTCWLNTSMNSTLERIGAQTSPETSSRFKASHYLPKSYTKRIVGTIFDGASHWAAFVASSTGTVSIMSSLGSHGNNGFQNNLTRVLRGIRAACQYTVWAKQIAWTFTFPPASQQHNSNNCGLYAAWFATTMLQSPSKSLCLNDILPFQHSRACIAMDLVARVKNLWRVKDEDPAIEEIVHYVVERQQRMKQVSNRRILPINAVHGPSPLRTVPLSANSILTPTLAPAATYAVSMTSASNPRPPPNPFSDKGSLTGPLPLPHAYITDPSLFIRSDSIYGLHIHDGFLDLAEQQPRYTADTYMAMGTVFPTYCSTLAYLGMNPKVIE
jgi:hypothetical protein